MDHALVAKGGADPGWGAEEAGDGGAFDLLEVGDDLNGAGAVADDGDFLAAEVVAGVPGTRVHLDTLEGVETRDFGP